MHEITQDILNKLHVMNDHHLSTDDEEYLVLIIESAIFQVVDFCHLDIGEWQPGLTYAVVQIVSDRLKEGSLTNYALNANDDELGVKSITEGDFTIQKETKAELLSKLANTPLDKDRYYKLLYRYRKLAR